jgi:hypothetical protein
MKDVLLGAAAGSAALLVRRVITLHGALIRRLR